MAAPQFFVYTIYQLIWPSPSTLHITHISMAISANLGRDTEHNSTKLVRYHPLGGVHELGSAHEKNVKH